MTDLRKVKEKAAEAFSKGKFAKAAELYAEFCKKDPRDTQAKLRMGDAWAKSGDKAKAIDSYKSAAEQFAKDGFLPRAIAASKLILELEPGHNGVQQMLADLYARKSGAPAPRADAAAAPPRGRHAPIALEDPPSPTTRPDAIELDPAPADAAPGEILELESTAAAPTRAVELEPAPSEVTIEVESTSAEPEAELELVEPEPEPEIMRSGQGLSADGPKAFDLSAELPPELQLHPPEPAPSPPPKAPPPATVVQRPMAAAPPGLKPRQAPAPRPAQPTGLEAALAQFDELEVDVESLLSQGLSKVQTQGDSLLHAVENAAELGARQRGEPAGSIEEALEMPDEPSKPSPDALPKIPLFSDLPPDAFIELFERCPLRRFGVNERIFQQGSSGDSFFVICAGTVRVFREDQGKRSELAALSEGAFFGEMALLSEAPRGASVESTSEDTQLLEISAAVLGQLSARHPQVAQALKKFVRQRLLANVMNSSALFQSFSKSDRRDLVQRFRARDVAKGEAIIREGEKSDGLYLILSGEVEVTKAGQALAKLKEGELFGEMSLLQRAPASATVTSTRRTSLLRLPREDFDQIIMSHPQVLALVSELSDERKRKTEDVIADMALGGEELVLV